MKERIQKQGWSFLLCTVLIVAMALTIGGCKDKNQTGGGDREANGSSQTSVETETTPQADGSVVGDGSKVFDLVIADQDGVETTLEVHTDQETVGEALLELKLIAGEEGEYGLYVKTVNGITADYDTDGVYWAFYINGEYASSGVDSTKITEGDQYSFRVEK